ncbi:hypothetical protein [Marilutibacter alkalisoli]|uniref:Uncharacterized protein n=1 Tax=Marilutibacter alkalisoli TaxID=2591633 RepID=A0A514BVS7_9GAMM|nr:hypothetical protein [Lysobacter alkalisoli]QDH71472.1 hypothetical protein FKV23_16275 [Lysobacter alkalisoli]
MTNPYRAPTAQATERHRSAKPGIAVLLVSLCLAGITALILTVVVPNFRDVLASFGAELPWLSRAVMDGYLVAWLLPACVAVAWFRWPNPRQRRIAALVIGLISLLVVLPMCLLALYLPIFSLATAL